MINDVTIDIMRFSVKKFQIAFLSLIVIFLFWPDFTLATSIPAGFAPSSFFLSKDSFYVGDSIKISTVLYNNSEKTLEGRVNFMDSNSIIESKNFSISSGGSQIFSIDWTATKGQHIFSAEINTNDNSLPKSDLKSPSITKTSLIHAPPQEATVLIPNLDPITAVAEKYITSTVPSVAPFVNPVLNTLDSVRNSSLGTIGNSINNLEKKFELKNKKGNPTSIKQKTDYTDQLASVYSISSNFLEHLWLYIQKGLYYIFKYTLLFYFVLLVLAFLGLKMIYRRLVK